jgi:hypothetical protein
MELTFAQFTLGEVQDQADAVLVIRGPLRGYDDTGPAGDQPPTGLSAAPGVGRP